MLDNFILGFSQLLYWQVPVAIVVGAALGIICGAMPGLSGTTGVALMIPFTYGLSPMPSMALLVSLYTASEYGGSISAITVNIPGAPAAVMSTVDGYPLTQKGRTGQALAISIVSSTFGGFFSTILLILFSIPLARVAIAFGPAEFFGLGVFGLSIVAGLAGKNWLKAILAGLIGLLIKTMGADPLTGNMRFTFGWTGLYDGVAFIPVMLGLFAISEVFFIIEEGVTSRLAKGMTLSKERICWREIRGLWKCMVRSSAIGTAVGIVPGAGAGIGSIISYNEARRFSKSPDEFGKGSVEGLCASETANNATVGGALVPLLTLGVPGSGATAVLIGAFMLHNINPGPLLFVNHPDIVYGIFICLFLANIAMLAYGMLGIRLWLKVAQVSPAILAPLIFGVAIIGSYGIGSSSSDVIIMIASGMMAYILRKLKFPLLPMVIALVLGYMVEISLRRALLVSHGDPLIFLKSPISLGFLLLAVLSITWTIIRSERSLQK